MTTTVYYPSFWCPFRRSSGLHSPLGSENRKLELYNIINNYEFMNGHYCNLWSEIPIKSLNNTVLSFSFIAHFSTSTYITISAQEGMYNFSPKLCFRCQMTQGYTWGRTWFGGVFCVVKHQHITGWGLGGNDARILRHIPGSVHLSLVVYLYLNLNFTTYWPKSSKFWKCYALYTNLSS